MTARSWPTHSSWPRARHPTDSGSDCCDRSSRRLQSPSVHAFPQRTTSRSTARSWPTHSSWPRARLQSPCERAFAQRIRTPTCQQRRHHPLDRPRHCEHYASRSCLAPAPLSPPPPATAHVLTATGGSDPRQSAARGSCAAPAAVWTCHRTRVEKFEPQSPLSPKPQPPGRALAAGTGAGDPGAVNHNTIAVVADRRLLPTRPHPPHLRSLSPAASVQDPRHVGHARVFRR